MAFQPSVVEFFNSRKRPAVDGRKVVNPNKVLVLDESAHKVEQLSKINIKTNTLSKKIVYSSKEVNILHDKKVKSAGNFNPSQVHKTKKNKRLKADGGQLDIRKSLFTTIDKGKIQSEANIAAGYSKEELTSKTTDDASEPNVQFVKKGTLSPYKQKITTVSVSNKELEENKDSLPKGLNSTEGSSENSKKELNVGKLKAMMSRSSRLAEMKAALKQFNEKRQDLIGTPTKGEQTENFSLEGFENIDFQVPVSPLKTPKKAGQAPSPQGKLTPSSLFSSPPSILPSSPLKSPLKSPAFQRYQALVTDGRPALVLPFKYRALAELFRCVDTVASMLHNRRETITLSKLRPGVQEISRKNLTEYHLGQIKTVFPNAFEFSMEKMHSFGSADKYELVLTPVTDIGKVEDCCEDGENKHVMMGPTILLARRRFLFNALLELTKTHHEEFLRALDPPMCIPRSRLTRWHPEFAVDSVPDILSASLPLPPNVERVTSAKDVLERARNLFVVNPRMERALQKVSENCAVSTPIVLSTPTPAIDSKPALHGVPSSLLEKVRAKQAAKALEAMTRTTAQAQEAVRLTRLPEMARIVRNLFVAEKKSVLAREVVIRKLADSYRESLTLGELDDHLKLLAEKTPGWITFCNLRKTDYVKLSRNADMNRIMVRLETLAVDSCV